MHITCNHCHGRFSAPDGLAGRSIKCPKCTNRIDVPFADIGDLLDEVSQQAPAKSQAPQGTSPKPVTDDSILNSYMVPTSAPKKARTRQVSAKAVARNALAIPCFVMFVVCIICGAVSAAMAFLLSYTPIVAAVPILLSFCAAAFWYWLGETIRLGRTAQMTDVFTEDFLHDSEMMLDGNAPKLKGVDTRLVDFAIVGALISLVLFGGIIWNIWQEYTKPNSEDKSPQTISDTSPKDGNE